MIQRTLVMVKPDGLRLQRSTKKTSVFVGDVVGEIVSRKLTIRRAETRTLSIHEAEKLYAEHAEKWFFKRNINHITSGPVMLMEVVGENAVSLCREMVISIRESYKFYVNLPCNLVHGTDNEQTAYYELDAVGFHPMENDSANINPV